jgi:hypothetical protein
VGQVLDWYGRVLQGQGGPRVRELSLSRVAQGKTETFNGIFKEPQLKEIEWLCWCHTMNATKVSTKAHPFIKNIVDGVSVTYSSGP